ncbi:glycosyl transferase [Streptomyces sparsogenes DSM 40356]|uniref:Glycosyl transferase n=2 Tax=Streptomyces sparsogenes TaxID=67365 RepID=A0A1R1SFL9_9ACTN|nr:glycosyl transferase [Streptomyces sparsogenes DSM 40356]
MPAMRVLLVTIPWRTHFQFCVPMAWALRTAGHEVHVASGPDLTDVIVQSGLTAVQVGSEEHFLQKAHQAQTEASEATWGGIHHPIDLGENREEMFPLSYLKSLCATSTEVAKAINDSMIDDLVAYCRWWKPDLVIWEWLSHAGAVAAAAVGAAHARMPIGIEVEARMRRHFLKLLARQEPADRGDPMAEWLGAWGEKHGFEFREELVTGQFTIDQVPDSMRLKANVPQVSVRHVPYNGRAVAPEWIRHEPPAPRVLATFGMSMWDMSSSQPVSSYQMVSIEQLQDWLDSLADLDMELVMTLPGRIQEKLKHVPRNTRLVDFVPLHLVIPSCAAVIHHGGLPAFCSSLAHGVPQLMVSRMAPDASVRGARLEEAQAGGWIPPERMTGKRIRNHLAKLLEDPSYRAGAERLRQEVLAQPSPNEVVPELERLAAELGSR